MTDEQKTTRKLRAILSADVKGYSLLMTDDEVYTVEKLNAYWNSMSALIQSHSGRVVDAVGDNLLAEFSSAVDAVQCAVEIQKDLKEKNDTLPESKRIEFRIGINIGDVIQEGDRIHGSGVNVAARIEGLAEPGGVCISRNAFDHIKDKLQLGYEYLGQHDVKNIKDPVRVYKVLIDPGDAGKLIGEKPGSSGKKWLSLAIATVALLLGVVVWQLYYEKSPPIEPVSVEKMAFPLPDKPSIAVLPFTNMSDDPKQEYFSDGITDDLITDLSKVSGLFVIARNSTFTYKGKPVKVQQVAIDLGVRYVLEGSVRKAADQVRINAQLIDAITGHHLWAERFDGQFGDVFALQDKFTSKIIAALAVKLTAGEQELIVNRGTANVEAYDMYLQGWEILKQGAREDMPKVIRYLQEAVELDPNYSRAHAALAIAYTSAIDRAIDRDLGWTDARSLRNKHLKLAMKNPSPYTYRAVAHARLYQRKYEEALEASERAIALAPNDPDSYSSIARVLTYAGGPTEAIEYLQKAMRINPQYPAFYLWWVGTNQFSLERYQDAVDTYERLFKRDPKSSVWIFAAAQAHLGRQKEAAEALTKYMHMRGSPGGSAENMLRFFPFKNPIDADRFVDGLLKAGLPRPWNPVYRRHYDEAITKAEQAIGLNPDDAEAQFTMGETLIYIGRLADGERFIKRAMELNPKYPSYYLWYLGLSQFCLEEYEEALALLEKYYERKIWHGRLVPKWLLAAIYAQLGRQKEAQEVLSEFMERWTYYKSYNVKKVLKDNYYAFKNQEYKDRLAEGLHKAGLPLK